MYYRIIRNNHPIRIPAILDLRYVIYLLIIGY